MVLILLFIIVMMKFSTQVRSIDNRGPPWCARLPVPVKNAVHFLLRPFTTISMQLGRNGPTAGSHDQAVQSETVHGESPLHLPSWPCFLHCAVCAVFPTSELMPIGPTLRDWAFILLHGRASFQLAGRIQCQETRKSFSRAVFWSPGPSVTCVNFGLLSFFQGLPQ